MAEGKAAALVREVAALKAIDIADSSAADARVKLGLEPPRALLTVYGEPESGKDEKSAESEVLLAEIAFGEISESGIAARGGEESDLYLLDAKLADQVPVNLSAFRARFLAPKPEPAAAAGGG
jgi:hypothetical protein